MNDIFKIVKLNFEIFNKRFKIKKITDFIVFYGFIIIVLSLFQIFFIKFGQYGKMYVLKLQILPIFLVGSIFPSYDLACKDRLKVFFGSINQKMVDRFYLYKNYFFTLLFMVYILFPYRFDLFKTALFCLSLWLLLYLVVLILQIYFNFYNINLIRLFLVCLMIYQVSSANIVTNLSPYADKLNISVYLILVIFTITISLKLLNKFEPIYKSKEKFIKIFAKTDISKIFGYNFLYILRSGVFAKYVYIFYINYICFVLNQAEIVAVFSFVVIIFITNFVFLHSVFMIENDKFKFIFPNKHKNSLLTLKYIDLLKSDLVYMLLIFPAVFYKIKILTFKVFISSIIFLLLFNLIEFLLISKNDYKTNKKLIKFGCFIGFIFIFLQFSFISFKL